MLCDARVQTLRSIRSAIIVMTGPAYGHIKLRPRPQRLAGLKSTSQWEVTQHTWLKERRRLESSRALSASLFRRSWFPDMVFLCSPPSKGVRTWPRVNIWGNAAPCGYSPVAGAVSQADESENWFSLCGLLQTQARPLTVNAYCLNHHS